MEEIKLNDILQLSESELKKAKIRFMTDDKNGVFNPVGIAGDEQKKEELNLKNLVHNRKGSISFFKDVIAIGFIRLPENQDHWLMTGMVKVVKDNGLGNFAEAEYYKTKQYNFRLVVKYHKREQNGIRNAKDFINNLEVIELWRPDKSVAEKVFPGYKNVSVSYKELKRKIEISDEWRTALKSRKGVYLITDTKTGKLYVGSAYGDKGILGRWNTYLTSGFDRDEKENGKYPNKKLKELVDNYGISYIQENFQYSILETFTDDVSDEYIIARESWWKDVLLTRVFGYNAN